MYCVNCGVKLAGTETFCPLCGTEAIRPESLRSQAELLYPRKPSRPIVTPYGVYGILTALFLLAMVISLQCDILINSSVTWSGYVIGGVLVLYVAAVLPGWFRKPNPVIFTPCTFVAIGVYLLYINIATGGNWFLSFAFPVTGGIGLIVTAVVVLLKYLRRGKLYILGGALIALGAFMPLMEFLMCLTFDFSRFFAWSLYPLIVLVLLGGMLIFLAISRPTREMMERKFFI